MIREYTLKALLSLSGFMSAMIRLYSLLSCEEGDPPVKVYASLEMADPLECSSTLHSSRDARLRNPSCGLN